jgi:lysophospholipase L1-like esterase
MRTAHSLVLTVLLLAATVVLAPWAGAAVGVQYVALGDSYSAGVGAGSYISSSGSCSRSTLAYPQLWANANAPASFVSVACYGAKTTDVSATQLSALSGSTTLVSISVGGNDVGFSKVMEDCVLYGTTTCVNEVNAAENQARTTLPTALTTLYGQIRARASLARVVVLGYPEFYDLSVSFCIGLSSTSRAKIDEGADVLDTVISTAAQQSGFAFADVRSRFGAHHEICDGSNSWLHSVDWSDLAQSYHPTASGQSGGYLPAFSASAP